MSDKLKRNRDVAKVSTASVHLTFNIVASRTLMALASASPSRPSDVALTYASQGYVLDTGRVVLSGSAAELLARGDLHDIYLGKR